MDLKNLGSIHLIDNCLDSDFISSSVSDRPLPNNESVIQQPDSNQQLHLKNPVINLEIIHPCPKAPLRKASRRGRVPGKNTILTNIPEKTVIEHKNIDIV